MNFLYIKKKTIYQIQWFLLTKMGLNYLKRTKVKKTLIGLMKMSIIIFTILGVVLFHEFSGLYLGSKSWYGMALFLTYALLIFSSIVVGVYWSYDDL